MFTYIHNVYFDKCGNIKELNKKKVKVLHSPASKGQKVKVGATRALRTLIRAASAIQHRNTPPFRDIYIMAIPELR